MLVTNFIPVINLYLSFSFSTFSLISEESMIELSNEPSSSFSSSSSSYPNAKSSSSNNIACSINSNAKDATITATRVELDVERSQMVDSNSSSAGNNSRSGYNHDVAINSNTDKSDHNHSCNSFNSKSKHNNTALNVIDESQDVEDLGGEGDREEYEQTHKNRCSDVSIADTKHGKRIRKLSEVLRNDIYANNNSKYKSRKGTTFISCPPPTVVPTPAEEIEMLKKNFFNSCHSKQLEGNIDLKFEDDFQVFYR